LLLFRLTANLENIGSTIFLGDSECQLADTTLQAAVEEFYRTLDSFGHGVGFKTFEAVEGIIYDEGTDI